MLLWRIPDAVPWYEKDGEMSMGTLLTIINIVTGIGSFLGVAAFAIVWWYFGSKEGREYQIELDDLFDRVDDLERKINR